MDVYFMRHGETDWNIVKRLQGTTDIALNQNGIDLARKVSDAVYKSGIFFDEIFSSPLVRAEKTAQIMNKTNAPIKIDERISEFCFGKAEGITLEEIKQNPKFSAIKNWFFAPEQYTSSLGSESFEDFFARIDSFLDDLRKIEKKKQSVLIVCHGGVVRALVLRMFAIPITDFAKTKIPNCSINKAILKNGVFHQEFLSKSFVAQ